MCKWDGGDYSNQVKVIVPSPLLNNKRVIQVDRCLAPFIEALNYAGMTTVASCCGHGKRPGSVILADGRELLICPDQKTARMMDKMFPALAEELQPDPIREKRKEGSSFH